MVSVLLLALILQQDRPVIQEVRTLTAGHARTGCWLPLKVRIAGPTGFEGEVTTSADAGFRVARFLRIPAGGTVDVILPVVVLRAGAKVEVVLRAASGEIERRALQERIQFLVRQRLVLVDPRHPEAESLRSQAIVLADGTPVVFAGSDPSDWNEAAEMGAFEAVDAVVASDDKAVELTMTTWQALGGALVTQPRRDLVERLREPVARFPSIDPAMRRFPVNETWIPGKRDSAILFIVIYGFAFFVAVYVTWSRKGGPWMLLAAAVGASVLFMAAFAAFFPKGGVAIRAWQGIVDAPEAPVSITICALWGSGPVESVDLGRIAKPVHATELETRRSDLEMRWSDGARWTVRGTVPGDSTRFVIVERLPPLEPWKPTLDPEGRPRTYKPEESEYYFRVPRKMAIRLQEPESVVFPPLGAKGLVEKSAARVFRIEVRR